MAIMRQPHLTMMWKHFHLKCYERICDLRTGENRSSKKIGASPILKQAKAEYATMIVACR